MMYKLLKDEELNITGGTSAREETDTPLGAIIEKILGLFGVSDAQADTILQSISKALGLKTL